MNMKTFIATHPGSCWRTWAEDLIAAVAEVGLNPIDAANFLLDGDRWSPNERRALRRVRRDILDGDLAIFSPNSPLATQR